MEYPIVVANWKMNLTLSEALILSGQIFRNVENIKHVDIVLCPPAVFLYPVIDGLRTKTKNLYFGLQNAMSEKEGEFTGETSLNMVKNVCDFAIVGHSERRRLFLETDEMVNKKVKFCLQNSVKPIVCIGEQERFHLEDHFDKEIERMKKQGGILTQIDTALEGVSEKDLSKICITYEPIWAVGTDNAASGVYAAAISYIIKNHLKEKFSDHASDIRVLYGGSVNSQNVREFMMQPNIDGLLVGRASLNFKEFCEICQIASQVKSGNTSFKDN
ncbi:MAG: triose-phosphate isomerase [Candidatus Berkelbacteria bacterium]|nr:triose-phosphate isomerase [Candidatus Berkelbacteria bacterium]